MKKTVIMCMLIALLAGCGTAKEYETVMDVQLSPEPAPMRQIILALPQEAVMAVFENDMNGKLYFCDGYEITVQILEGGDLEKTIQEITGFQKDKLTLMETVSNELKRVDCVWTASGEQASRIGKTAILDDGSYHYVLSVMADETNVEGLAEGWQKLFKSFTAVSTAA